MPLTRLPFASLAWTEGTHPLERKKLVDGRPVAMLEFAPGFEDPSWCERGHVIHVLEGTLEVVLDDRVERFDAGDACVIDPGTRHRARNPEGVPVRLFVISS
jgi:quercetin dioxygenase-like cupin family protein